MGNVKNILLIKGNKTTQYIITCIDALIYVFLLKSITSDNTIYAVLAFVCGKSFSITLTDIIMSRISKTVYLAHLYEKKKEIEKIIDYLTVNNISFTIFEGDYINGTRYMLTMHLNKQQINDLKHFLSEDLKIQNITMDISEVKVSGHIEDKV
jgi:uncharacterized membrane-anchored protein YitT (DUF2179 family)